MISFGVSGDREPKGIQESDHCHGEGCETSEIGKTSGSEDVTSAVARSIALWIGIVQVVISFCMIQ